MGLIYFFIKKIVYEGKVPSSSRNQCFLNFYATLRPNNIAPLFSLSLSLYGATAQLGPTSPCLRFLDHTKLDSHTRQHGGQPVAKAATHTTHNKHKSRVSMPSAEFETAIPAVKRLQTYALDRAATAIGNAVQTLHQCCRTWGPRAACSHRVTHLRPSGTWIVSVTQFNRHNIQGC